MNPSYFKINLSMKEAIDRLNRFVGNAYKEKIETNSKDCVNICLDQTGQWKGRCLYAFEKDNWSIFEDLSGSFSGIPAKDWLNFAKGKEVLFAGYNDAIRYGEFIVVKNGKVEKEFFEVNDEPQKRCNKGQWKIPINSWIDIADFMDRDPGCFSEQGIVLIY